MKLSRVIQAVYARPWVITRSGWETVHRLVQSKLAGDVVTRRVQNDGLDIFGEPMPVPETYGGIRVIPIQGIIGHKVGLLEKSCGVCDVLDVREQVAEALASVDVTAILLDIDSPGGIVTGVPELADVVRTADAMKPVYAFTDDMMCSAAYWLGSQARGVFATRTADVGSIGVYMAILDESLAFQMAGLHLDVFKGGTQKGAGLPGTSLNDEQRAHFQGEIDQIYGWFKRAVTRGRQGNVTEETMQGQSFLAEAAAEFRLIDGIVADRAELLNQIAIKPETS
jgi:signal peptide peptidase SppA